MEDIWGKTAFFLTFSKIGEGGSTEIQTVLEFIFAFSLFYTLNLLYWCPKQGGWG